MPTDHGSTAGTAGTSLGLGNCWNLLRASPARDAQDACLDYSAQWASASSARWSSASAELWSSTWAEPAWCTLPTAAPYLTPGPWVDYPAMPSASSDQWQWCTPLAASPVDIFMDALAQRSEEANVTAREILECFLSTQDSRATKSSQDIAQFFASITARRNTFLAAKACHLGSPEPGPGQYTARQWREWLGVHHILTEYEMKEAIAQWKQDFQQNHMKQQDKVQQWWTQNTRDSKHDARQLNNGAWKAHLKDLYGRHQLAIAFLKYPTAAVDTLLEGYRTYRKSPSYDGEVERSRKSTDPMSNTAWAIEAKQRAVEMRMKAHRLRHQCRRARHIHKALQQGKITQIPDQEKNTYAQWLNGTLTREKDIATRRHGYGLLSTGEELGPDRLTHFLPRELEATKRACTSGATPATVKKQCIQTKTPGGEKRCPAQ
jgi:hypothetical protein